MLAVRERWNDAERRGYRAALVPSGLQAPVPAALRERSLRNQLERAAQVQRSLLPDLSGPIGRFRLASLYRPCETIGGDFYDLVRRRDCTVLLVADVMGHGAAAALVTMLVKAVFQEAAESTDRPCELLATMDVRLRRLLPEGVFVAAAAVRLDLQDGDLQVANAGLPYPFLVRAWQRRVEEVRLCGRPLGLSDGDGHCAYESCALKLSPGDVLLIASDGLGSIRGDGGRRFEDQRLVQVLGDLAGHDGKYFLDRLGAEAIGFGHGRPLPDDVNVVAVSRSRIAG